MHKSIFADFGPMLCCYMIMNHPGARYYFVIDRTSTI